MNWKHLFSKTILDRGKRYYNWNAVDDIEIRNGQCNAFVVGSREYQVSIWKKANYQLGMSCSCPYAQGGGRCKHMAAVCYELDDMFAGDTNWSELGTQDAKSPKETPKRIFPFVSKNTPDGKQYYTFDLAVMIGDMVIYEKTWEEAKKIVENGNIELDKVEVNYYGGYYSSKELRGQAIAYVKEDEKESYVMVHFTPNEVTAVQCKTINCQKYYEAGSYYRNKETCRHGLAALILLSDYIDLHNPGDTTDYETMCLLNDYEMMYRKQVVGRTYEVQGDFHLEPRLEAGEKNLILSFKGGIDKLFVIKDLTEFTNNVEEKNIHPFGTKTQIDFKQHRISEESLKYYDFIFQAVKEEEKRRYMQGFSYGTDKIKGGIPLLGKRLDDVYELLEKSGDTIVFNDKWKEIKNATLAVRELAPPINMVITEDYDSKKIFRGIKVSGEFPEIWEGNQYQYYIESGFLNRVPRDARQALEPLFQVEESGVVELSIGRKSMAVFYNRIVPALEKYVTFIENNSEIIENYLPPKAEFIFYLDTKKKRVVCDAKVKYGEEIMNLAAHTKEDIVWNPAWDQNAEAEAVFYVNRFFPNLDDREEVYLSSDDEEATLTIIEQGISELLKIGEVFCTERLKQIKIRKKAKVSVGVSMGSGIMQLDITSDEYSNEELLDILASYRRKKKYIRLKNGDFLNLEDENLELISDMMNTLHIGFKDFLKGKIHIPAYRALYLDKMLEKNETLYVNRDKHFKKLIKEFKTVSDSDFELPENFQKVMRNYQVTGYRFLRTLNAYGFGGILADDMGLGKTLQVISVIQAAKEEKSTGTSLVIAPASLIYNWQEEFEKFSSGLNVQVISGTKENRKTILDEYKNYDVLITSYDLLKRDIAEYEEKEFSYQIVDEAQYIKNHSTAVAKAVKCIVSRTRYALTGTPIENRLSELWSIFDYLMPGFLYGYENFRKELESPIVKNKDEKAADMLKKMISPFILRRLKTDVLKDLPEKLEETYFAKFEPKQQQIYDAQVVHMKQMLAKQSGEEYQQSKIQILAELTKLRQICCDPSLLLEDYKEESAKRQACMELVKSAIEGEHRILLFSQFTSMLSLLEESLKKENFEYFKITGSTPKEERISLVKKFNEGTVPVFLISLKAGGTGLNLVGADVVIHYDPWWNVAVQNQATDRAHRIGQEKIVTVYRMIIKNTIEEKIVKMQDAKKHLADEILNGENGGLAALSKEELLELL